jgi:hypothetical protein
MNTALEPMHDTEARKFFMRGRPDAASNPYYRAALYPHLEFHRSLAVDPAIKFERIFARAPDWLLIFTAVDFDAKLLGFRLRKLRLDELPDNAVIARNDWPWIPRTQYQSRSPSVIPQIPWNQVVEDHCNRILSGGRARPRRIRRGAQSRTIVDASPDSL